VKEAPQYFEENSIHLSDKIITISNNIQTNTMRDQRYLLDADPSYMSFEFISVGPKGHITKLVKYTAIDELGIYNLGFGDKTEGKDDFDDTIVSDNKDSIRILATVAATIYSFTDFYENVLIFATGSTPTRTRLYRIGISNNLSEIEEDFVIQGYINNHWELFRKNRNYSAFLINRK
jgi:hypothetical protein